MVALERLDRGNHRDPPGLQRIEEPDVDDRHRVVAQQPFVEPVRRRRQPVRRQIPDVDPAPPGDDEGYTSEEDRAQVEARLRALGYVE